jgi:hypothetical protein
MEVLTGNKIFSNIFKAINDIFKKKTDVENPEPPTIVQP